MTPEDVARKNPDDFIVRPQGGSWRIYFIENDGELSVYSPRYATKEIAEAALASLQAVWVQPEPPAGTPFSIRLPDGY
jgi:uncharacterized protein YegP (UPF0339 family)